MTTEPQSFVPPAEVFEVPVRLVGEGFRLEPLGPEHNEGDLAAWSGSIDHVRATPGFLGDWPPEEGMSAEANLADLVRHARDFAERRGFTYSVLDGERDGEGEVIGCLYIYPGKVDPERVHVTSWVRGDRAAYDKAVYGTVTRWLAEAWPFPADRIDYAPR
ncbi:N-acetyltransferase [Streptomyces sp. NBC_01264]|uniref:N-acetyltransferase n=1 Tax=Streptomyces sp. NBC_01264 TaxID=2903804 RepID=UPI0022546613|nr:N-acetyltransferase [Streptomyces sp. NBC_01264]MCX4779243.1 N-acetyltransferase [Streptomyces sp. NBC_01264]